MSTDQAAAQEKIKQIILGLAERAQSLGWDTTADERTFVVSFPTHSVTLRKWGALPGEYEEYEIAVLDQYGRELESYSTGAEWGHELRETLKSLYSDARRGALQVDKGLDAVLKEIEAV